VVGSSAADFAANRPQFKRGSAYTSPINKPPTTKRRPTFLDGNGRITFEPAQLLLSNSCF